MVFVKDLSKIGRPLNKTIIVDNVAENFSLQPDNGIFIKSWFDDMNDTALLELAPLLKQIVQKSVKDVREALRKFRDQMLEQIQRGIINPQLSLWEDNTCYHTQHIYKIGWTIYKLWIPLQFIYLMLLEK